VVTGRTDAEQKQFRVECRLGYYGAPNTGTAYFDDVELKEIPPPDDLWRKF
jgi:hypothetical protein